jgi:hypothetical protein
MPNLDLSFLAAPGLLWWIALPAGILAGVWAYHRLPAPLRPTERGVLRLLRLTALVLLLLLLLEPLVSLRRAHAGRPRIAVLIDRSSSMRLPGRQGGTRGAEAESVRVRLERELAGRHELQVAGFAADLEPAGHAAAADPEEPQGCTALGEALEGALLRQGDSPLGGIVLVSDGVHTAGKDPAQVARNLPAPVFAVALGDSVSPPDLVLREIDVHPVAQVGEPTAVRAVLESQGMEGWEAAVEVRPLDPESGQPRGPALARRAVRLSRAPQGEVTLTLEFVPRRVGWSLYEIVAAVPDSEAVRLNNRRWFALDVRERKTRILLVTGAPDWDFAFLKRAFDEDTVQAYTYQVRQKDGSFLAYGSQPSARLPASRAELGSYAAVLVDRLAPEHLPNGFADALREFLLEGGGVFFLGAPAASEASGWEAAGWSELLPVRTARQPRLGHALSQAEVTLEGLTHEITALSESPAETERQWKDLPPLWVPEGSYAVASGARVLLTGRTAQPARGVPLLAVATAGAGRLGVLTGHGWWRWDFAMRSGGEGEPLARDLWKRTARWLSEPAERSRFDVRPERAVFQDGEAVAFTARVLGPAFEPIEGARVNVEIVPADTTGGVTRRAGSPAPRRVALYPQGPAGRYAGAVVALAPGAYRFRAEGYRREGDVQGRTEGVFWVEPMGPEYLRLGNSIRTLRQIARLSGGEVRTSGDPEALATALPRALRPVQVVRQAEIWNHWAIFALLTALLSVEWGLRRRRGLA